MSEKILERGDGTSFGEKLSEGPTRRQLNRIDVRYVWKCPLCGCESEKPFVCKHEYMILETVEKTNYKTGEKEVFKRWVLDSAFDF